MRQRSSRVAKGEWGFRRHRRLTTRGKKGKTSANVGRRLGGKEKRAETGSSCASTIRRDERTSNSLLVALLANQVFARQGYRYERISCGVFKSGNICNRAHVLSLSFSFSLSTINRAVGSLSCQFFLQRQRLIKH